MVRIRELSYDEIKRDAQKLGYYRLNELDYGMPVYGIYNSITDEIEIFRDMPKGLKELVLKHELRHVKSRRLIRLLWLGPLLGIIVGSIAFNVSHKSFVLLLPVIGIVITFLLCMHLEIKAGYDEEIRKKVEELKEKMG